MPFYPQSATGLNYIGYPVGPVPSGLTVTAGTANVKGTYAQVVASSPFACRQIQIFVSDTVNGNVQYLLDIGTGAAASEVVLIPDVLVDAFAGSNGYGAGQYVLPAAIPAGTRIAARCQASTGASTISLRTTLVAAGGEPGAAGWVNYGAASGDSGGTSVDPGGTADTKGAWTQLTAASSAVAQVIVPMMTLGGNAEITSARWLVDIGTGAAASEVVLIPDLGFRAVDNGVNAGDIMPKSYTLLTYIPASTRMAARASCSTNDATDRLLDLAVLAGTAPAESTYGAVGGQLVNGGLVQ